MFMYHNNNITFQSQIKINSRVCTITAWKLPHYHCAYTLASGITQNEQLPLAQARPTMLAFTSYYYYYYRSRIRYHLIKRFIFICLLSINIIITFQARPLHYMYQTETTAGNPPHRWVFTCSILSIHVVEWWSLFLYCWLLIKCCA